MPAHSQNSSSESSLKNFLKYALRALLIGISIAAIIYFSGGLGAIPIIGAAAIKGWSILAAGSLIGTAGGVIYSSIKALFNFCKTPKTPPQKKTQRPIKIPVILLESSCTTPESPTQGSRSRIYQGLSISPSAITSSPNENNHGKSDDEREIIGNDQSDQSASITYHENGRDPENVSDFIDDYTKDHEAGLEILP